MDDTDPPPVVYTDRQRELIRARMEKYYDVQSVGPRKASWGGICDEIFDDTGVHVRDEVVRQWVKRFVQKGRTKPLEPNAEELNAIVSALMHPDINMLSDKELNEPEIPYRFAEFLLDFLAHPRDDQLFPPKELDGRYLALLRFNDGSIHRRIELTLRVHEQDHVIRVSESSQTWASIANMSDGGKSSTVLKTTYMAKGWGIITPEDNLFLFMKNDRYGYNHYYLTMALYPDIWSETSACQLALLRHVYPVLRDSDSDFDSASLGQLMQETDGETALFLFNKAKE